MILKDSYLQKKRKLTLDCSAQNTEQQSQAGLGPVQFNEFNSHSHLSLFYPGQVSVSSYCFLYMRHISVSRKKDLLVKSTVHSETDLQLHQLLPGLNETPQKLTLTLACTQARQPLLPAATLLCLRSSARSSQSFPTKKSGQ